MKTTRRRFVLGGALASAGAASVVAREQLSILAGDPAAAAEAEVEIAEADVRRLELDLRSRFASAYAGYQTARRISEAYRTEIIPKADQAYRLYLEKYQQMTAAYPQVLIARRTWLQVNLDYLDALDELYRAALPLRGFLLTGGAEDVR